MGKIYYLAFPEGERGRKTAARVTKLLRRAGHAVINPYEIENADLSRLSDLLLVCDGLILAGKWREDEGCRDCLKRALLLRLEIVEKWELTG